MVKQSDIVRRTVTDKTWQKFVEWEKRIKIGKSYSKTRQTFKEGQDSFSALAEAYYAKWLEANLVPAKWNGLKVHTGGDQGDIELSFDKWIDVKAREIKKPFSNPEYEMTYDVNVDHRHLKDSVGYYMFAIWCKQTMQISLVGWLATDELNNRRSSRIVKRGEIMFGQVLANNDLTMIQVQDLNPLSDFYYGQKVKKDVDNWIVV